MSTALPVATRPFWISAFLDLPRRDFERGVEFWARVTGSKVSSRRGDEGEFATLVPPDGDDHLRVQRLRDGPARIHLDLHVADPRAAADRAVALGATEDADHADHGYVVLASPAGLTFCFVTHRASVRSTPPAWAGGRSQVDQVCLDVGPAAYDAECTFWHELTGFASTAARSAEFQRLDGEGQPLRLLLQRLDDQRPAGVHLDLAADDRAAEVARHVALGAAPVRVTDRGFTVLRDPAGSPYCVTDRVPREV